MINVRNEKFDYLVYSHRKTVTLNTRRTDNLHRLFIRPDILCRRNKMVDM